MQQRAAAQARLSPSRARDPSHGADDLTDPTASHEYFEAHRSQLSLRYRRGSHNMGMMPRTPAQERLRTPASADLSIAFGVQRLLSTTAGRPTSENEKVAVGLGSQSQPRRDHATMIPSSASTRSLVSKIVSDDRDGACPDRANPRTTSRSGCLAPRLDSSLLRVASIKIQGTNYRAPDRGKDAISFFITVDILHPPASWGPTTCRRASPHLRPHGPSRRATATLSASMPSFAARSARSIPAPRSSA